MRTENSVFSKNIRSLLVVTGLTLYVGGLLNIPVCYRRLAVDGLNIGFVCTEILLVIAVTLSIFTLSSFSRRSIFRTVSVFIILLSSIGSYYTYYYGIIIGQGIVESVFTTEADFILEIVNLNAVAWVLITGVFPCILFWRASRLHRSIFSIERMKGAGVANVLVFASAALLVVASVKMLNAADRLTDGNDLDMPSSASLVAHRYLPSNWISGLGMSLSARWQQYVQEKNLIRPSERYSWSMPAKFDDAIVLLVIGETARWDHMGMLGYERSTTPRLERESHLIAMSGQSCNTATALSLRCMFVRPEGLMTTSNGIDIEVEDNVFSIFKRLGFSIDLFAMQGEVGFYNKTHADSYKIREVITAEAYNAGKPVDDMLLVREVSDTIRRWKESGSKGPHLVILHTKGSHYLYSKRHPDEFALFKPECLSSDIRCHREQLINSYDNSILYTDRVLDALIDSIRGEKAFMFYTSDHGESIDENLHLHGTPKAIAPKEQFAVPFVLWFSERWLADNKAQKRFDQLKSSSGATRPHGEIFDSLLGCTGISSPDGGINPHRNWCASIAG